MEQKKTQVITKTKVQAAAPPKLTQEEKAEACTRLSGEDTACANPVATGQASLNTKGANRLQVGKSAVKKVVMDF